MGVCLASADELPESLFDVHSLATPGNRGHTAIFELFRTLPSMAADYDRIPFFNRSVSRTFHA